MVMLSSLVMLWAEGDLSRASSSLLSVTFIGVPKVQLLIGVSKLNAKGFTGVKPSKPGGGAMGVSPRPKKEALCFMGATGVAAGLKKNGLLSSPSLELDVEELQSGEETSVLMDSSLPEPSKREAQAGDSGDADDKGEFTGKPCIMPGGGAGTEKSWYMLK